MLSKRNFELEYVKKLQAKYGRDPALFERVLYAFGLLEALVQAELPFIFKGGTCLMLLLDRPERLSTDIDIIIEPGTDIEVYIKKASKIFPFITYEEQVRLGKNYIEKRHFKFYYDSPLTGKRFYILLDVLFTKTPYAKVMRRELKNELILIEEPKTMITIPAIDAILGDKLTAFAPHTTGIPHGAGRELEIAKQLFDAAILFDKAEEHEILAETYDRIVKDELSYRGLALHKKDVLTDTIDASACIISRGLINKQEYAEYLRGIKSVGNHILNMRYSAEIASHQACKVMYTAACLLTGTTLNHITDPKIYVDKSINSDKYKRLSYIKKQNLEAYGYLVEAIRLLGE